MTSIATSMTWSIREVAERIGVHENTIRREIAKGSLPSLRIGDRLLVRPKDVEAWLERLVTSQSTTRVSRSADEQSVAYA